MRALNMASLIVISALSLTACGGGGDSPQQTAPLTLRVTDSPIDPTLIDRVCVAFNGITVHYADQAETVLPYLPLPSQVSSTTHCVTGAWGGTAPVPPVRLDALGGPLTVALAESMQIPVGRVTWIRLHFAGTSYVGDKIGGQHPLRCPSCDVTESNGGRGFKLNRTFEVTTDGLGVMVDIDLLKSLHEDSSGYVLRPTARIELDGSIGTIAGTVEEGAMIGALGVPYDSTTVETGCAVYVYAGEDFLPTDHYEGSPIVASARVRYDTALGVYRYAVGALLGGTVILPLHYTAALTCDADDPLADDDTATVAFVGTRNVAVVAGQTVTSNFPQP
jgi:hypothetical protein